MTSCQLFKLDNWTHDPLTLALEPRKIQISQPATHSTAFILDTLDRLWRLETHNGTPQPELLLEHCEEADLEEGVADFCEFPGQKETFILISRRHGKLFLYDYARHEVVEDLSRNLRESTDSPVRRACAPTFRSCQNGRNHVILVDREGQVWSWCGEEGRPQSGRVAKGHEDSPELRRGKVVFTQIECMDSIRVVSVRCGNDFNVALIEHGLPSFRTAMEEGVERVSCPLGLPLDDPRARLRRSMTVQERSEEESSEVHFRKKKQQGSDQDQQDSAISSQTSSPKQVERLAQSGMYINPTDALKYLSQQLSWMTPRPEEEPSVDDVPTTERPKTHPGTEGVDDLEAVNNGLYRATTAVADGVKLVGRTMSNLSASFSSSVEKDTSLSESRSSLNIPMSNMENQGNSNGDNLRPKLRTRKPIPTRQATHSHRRSQSASMICSMTNVSNKDVSVPESNLLSPSSGGCNYEVWMWGRGKEGQCGIGDTLDRYQPSPIEKLTDKCILKISCGVAHCLALSSFGTVYGWGDNTRGQAHPKGSSTKSCLTPKLFELPRGETACDILAVMGTSFILTDTGKIYKSELHEESQTAFLNFLPLYEMHEQSSTIPRALFAQDQSFFVLNEPFDKSVREFRSLEKRFLGKLHQILYRVVEYYCDKSRHKHVDPFSEQKEHLLEALKSLFKLVARSVAKNAVISSLEKSYNLFCLDNMEDFDQALTKYHGAYCDCLVGDGLILDNQEFHKLFPVICEILEVQCDTNAKNFGQDILSHLLKVPISHFEILLNGIDSMTISGRRQGNPQILKLCDMLEKYSQSVKTLFRSLAKDEKITLDTKKFWDLAGPKFSTVKSYSRRVLLDSRVVPVGVAHSGSFSKHVLILMNDLLVHAGYSSITAHPLQTVWIDNHHGSGADRLEIKLIMPEETLTLVSPNAESKNEWIITLQRAILTTLHGKHSMTISPPITRNTSYNFVKISDLRGAQYQGSWMQGKMHGQGTITWPDGRIYRGQLRQNQKHGHGVLEVKTSEGVTVYEGQWKMDKLEGRGFVNYDNGDYYEGTFKDGKPHGQGTMKQGRFMGSGAFVYIGEWVNGYKNGYGVSDEIIAGEKFMGLWQQDMKSGPGCVVTVDGVYYEGQFSHNKLTGKGFMVFEDDTSYEGNFADAGVFSGQGTLTYANGDRLEGHFHGSYGHGMKFNGTIFRNIHKPSINQTPSFGQESDQKIGRFTVKADKKWLSIFSGFFESLGLNPSVVNGDPAKSGLIWEQLAICINQAKNDGMVRAHFGQIERTADILEGLEIIPNYHSFNLDSAYYQEVQAYLDKAFTNVLHPLRDLLTELTDCFNATYGSVRIHPRLLKHSVDELRSIVERLYLIVRSLFPALPKNGDLKWITDPPDQTTDLTDTMVTSSLVIYPHILPKIHSSIFMLYALHYKKDDDDYWVRIVKWNRHTDLALLTFLEVNQKFWQFEDDSQISAQIRESHFVKAIETLQHLKTKFTPYEKLLVIMETFKEVNKLGQELCGEHFYWSMDELFPVLQFIVVRARILQLGAEIHLMEDLIEPALMNGEFGIMFTTLQANYFQILKESLAI